MKKSKLTFLFSGILVMVSTVIAYFLILNDVFSSPIKWVSLMFLLIAEAATMFKAVFASRNIISGSMTFVSTVHFGLVLLLSVLFLIAFENNIKSYILINILLVCGVLAIDLCIIGLGHNVSAENKKLAKSSAIMAACGFKAQELATTYASSEYQKEILDVCELIRFSDNTTLTDDEELIMAKLESLDAELKAGGENISFIIEDIKNTVNLRSAKIKIIKRGSY